MEEVPRSGIGGGRLRRPIHQNGKNRNDTNASWAQTLASPLGEEGHEVAKGCWRVRIGKNLKVEQAAYRRSRPRWSVTSVLDLVHPMAPQGATRVGGEKSLSHTLPAPFRRFPLWWLRHHLSPYSGGTMGAGLLSQFMFMAITAENLYTRPYGRSPAVKVLGREAAFQNCARRAPPQPSARRDVKPENPYEPSEPSRRRRVKFLPALPCPG